MKLNTHTLKRSITILSIVMVLASLFACSASNSVMSRHGIQKRKYNSGWFVKSGAFRKQQKNKEVRSEANSARKDKRTLGITQSNQQKYAQSDMLIGKRDSLELKPSSPKVFQEKSRKHLFSSVKLGPSSKRKTSQNEKREQKSNSFVSTRKKFQDILALDDVPFLRKKPKVIEQKNRPFPLPLGILIVLGTTALPILLTYILIPLVSINLLTVIGLLVMPIITFVMTYFYFEERRFHWIFIGVIVTLVLVTSFLIMLNPISYLDFLQFFALLVLVFVSALICMLYLIFSYILAHIKFKKEQRSTAG